MKNWTKWMHFMHQRRMNIHIHWTFSRGNLHILLKCEKSLKSKHHPLVSPLLQACALFHTIPQTSHRQNVSSNSKNEWNYKTKTCERLKNMSMGLTTCASVWCMHVRVYVVFASTYYLYVYVYTLERHECVCVRGRNKTWPIQVLCEHS